MKKHHGPINILIPNVTGPTNIGDQAILRGLLYVLYRNFPQAKIIVHSTNPTLYPRQRRYVVRHTLYSWAVFDKLQFFTRLKRLLLLFFAQASLRLGLNAKNFVFNAQLSQLIDDYSRADVIVFSGGGYLRSRKGFTQTLNLLMQLAMFLAARFVTGKKIVAPISFGPFAYGWQEKIAYLAMKDFDVVAAREAKSYEALKLLGSHNLTLANDTALLITRAKKMKTRKARKSSTVLGFTVRNWLNNKSGQDRLEQVFTQAIVRFSQTKKVVIQPIIQVVSPIFSSEDDSNSVNRVVERLQTEGLHVQTPIRVSSVNHALNTYRQLDLLLGMRMHSNILAAIQGVPFVAVSYEHKTEGIAKQMAMEKYCIPCDEVSQTSLYELLLDAYKHKQQIKQKLLSSTRKIRNQEISQWKNLLLAI